MTSMGSHAREMTSPDHIVRLETEARYHRERLALYRARVYGGSLTSPSRLQELERTCEFAEGRLQRARASRPVADPR
jgi:hypothetical protein